VTASGLLRAGGPVLLALLAAWAFDRLTARRGFDPPGFAVPWRRAIAFLAIAFVLWVGVFAPVGEFGRAPHLDLSRIAVSRLFLLHEMMIGAILVWFFAGFAGVPRPLPAAAYPPSEPLSAAAAPALAATVPDSAWAGEQVVEPDPALAPAAETLAAHPPPVEAIPERALVAPLAGPLVEAPLPPPRVPLGRQLLIQLGLDAPSPAREVGLGVVLGVGAWMAVIVAVAVIAFLLIYVLNVKDALPKQPPTLIPWLAGLPFGVRLLLALSAGVVEEGFFRGLLQPRIGIALSTALFILAHTAYGQPFLLIGVGILSVIYALLVRWRQNIWPAMTAHALFDGVQLLVIIPAALKLMGGRLPTALLGLF
jgi:membrane protease YdiL (CAAX protease family)